jgi:predicted acetyltransferase
MELRWPSRNELDSYCDALRSGWSPNTMRPEVAGEQLVEIEQDADAFLQSLVNWEGTGEPITLPDGTKAGRLPGFHRWMWDETFCGSINVRWQPGTTELPPHVLGHIGYSVVPWMQGRGYATAALGLAVQDIIDRALIGPFVELTTDVDNVASQRVIEANGGVLVERCFRPPMYGSTEMFRYRIPTL